MTRLKDVLLAVILCASCADRAGDTNWAATNVPGGPPSPLPNEVAAAWATFDGDGFTLRYPAEAGIVNGSSHPSGIVGKVIRGPRVHIARDPETGPSDGPAYELHITSFPNPHHLTVDQWVDNVRRERNARPMDPDSVDIVAPPVARTLGGHRVLSLAPYCGDCEAAELYVGNAKVVAVLSFALDVSIPGDREAQRRLYETITSSLAWTR